MSSITTTALTREIIVSDAAPKVIGPYHFPLHIYKMRATGKFEHFATKAVHVGQNPEQWDMNQIVPPISLSTTYKQHVPGQPKKYDYARLGNPTRDVLEKTLAALEDAKYCCVFSSGLSAVMAITNFLKTDDHIICCDDVYGGTQRFFRRIIAPHHGIQITMTDLTDSNAYAAAVQTNTKMVWVESPSNPLLKVVDIASVVAFAKKMCPDALVVVDNTFMSPYYQRPLTLGADVVVHSISKYINGHSDVLMGCAMTNDTAFFNHLKFQQVAVGAIPSPFDCYLVLRGIKTLHLRMQAHSANAMQVARYLETNVRVRAVLYPELESHPQHAIHRRQTTGMSGMMSFYLRGGIDESRTFLAALKVFTIAISLGGYESLAELPAIMTHASVPSDEREKLCIGDNLIRLSVGIEDIEDIIADLDQALKKAIPIVHDDEAPIS